MKKSQHLHRPIEEKLIDEDDTVILTYNTDGNVEYVLEAPAGPQKWMDKVWAISRVMYDDNGKVGMVTKADGRHTYYEREHLQYQDGKGPDGMK